MPSISTWLGHLIREIGGKHDLFSKWSPSHACVITGVGISRMDGRKLHRVVSATHPQALMFPISAFQDEQDCERALALGAFAFLSRPLRKRFAMHG